MAQGATRVASVDGLRGLLALFVMTAHIGNSAGDPRLIGMANDCVLAFFVISGYVLTVSWRGFYASFLVRRAIRLWPLFAACIAVGGWLSMNPAPVSVYLWSPLQVWGEQPPQDPPTWSLFVEVWAMPFMPLIIWIARRQYVLLAVFAALMVARVVGSPVNYLAFFLMGSAFSAHRPASRLMESAPVQWLGRISYSLYLTHCLVIGALKFHAPHDWLWLAVPCCLATAHLAWLTIEAPSVALSRLAGRAVERWIGARARGLAPA